jgi:hypothetical protein
MKTLKEESLSSEEPVSRYRLANASRLLLRYSPIAFMITALAIDLSCAEYAFAADGWWNGNDPGEFAGGVIRDVHCDLVELVEGSFGGMLTAVAGAMGLVYAALGNPKYSIAAVIVACGSFGMSAGISLYFGDVCEGQGARGARQVQAIQGANTKTLPAQFQLPGFGTDANQGATLRTFEQEDDQDPFSNF